MLRRANKYIDETAPWVLAKDESKKEVLGTVLYNLLETIRVGAVLLTPFMPSTAASIFKQLNTEAGDLSTVENFGVYAGGNGSRRKRNADSEESTRKRNSKN